MAYEVGRLQYRSGEMSLVLIVPAAGTCSELVPLGAELSVVAATVGIVVFVVEVAVAAAVG